MSKIRESLREEIAAYIANDISYSNIFHQETDQHADDIINKVLDAFEASYLEYDPYFEGDSKEAFYNAMTDVRPNK